MWRSVWHDGCSVGEVVGVVAWILVCCFLVVGVAVPPLWILVWLAGSAGLQVKVVVLEH